MIHNYKWTFYLALIISLFINKKSYGATTAYDSIISEGKIASQSTTNPPYVASLAVDGKVNQNAHENSCSHTARSSNPWWQLDLGSRHQINKLSIYSRGDCCGDRLGGLKVQVSSSSADSFTECASGPARTKTGQIINLSCVTVGRFVRISLPGSNKILTLCEVKIYGSRSDACQQIKESIPSSPSDIYSIAVNKNSMQVYCDMTDQTAWIVIQRRLDGTQPFDKSWIEYKNGFGDLNGEFWLGNEKLHQLTSAGSMKIRFDLWDKDDKHAFAEYSEISVSGESDNYRLTISGYSGNAGDSMSYHNQMQFSTKDRDNDMWLSGSCSQYFGKGGWWFGLDTRIKANLNGNYQISTNKYWSPYWNLWKYNYEALKKIIMKITYK